MEQKNIKTRYGAFKLHLFMGFQSTYFRYNWMRDYLISTQQNKVKIRFRACKLHSSSHSNQYDFIMHKRIHRLFNFHKTKENQNMLGAFKLHLLMGFQSKPVCKSIGCKIIQFP